MKSTKKKPIRYYSDAFKENQSQNGLQTHAMCLGHSSHLYINALLKGIYYASYVSIFQKIRGLIDSTCNFMICPVTINE